MNLLIVPLLLNGGQVLHFNMLNGGQVLHFNKMETARYLVTSTVRELGKLEKWLKCAT